MYLHPVIPGVTAKNDFQRILELSWIVYRSKKILSTAANFGRRHNSMKSNNLYKILVHVCMFASIATKTVIFKNKNRLLFIYAYS